MSFRTVSLSFLLCSVSVTCLAQGTKVWTESHMEEWEKGRPQGVAISSDGSLSAAPASTLTATTPSTYIWAIASDKLRQCLCRDRLARHRAAHRARRQDHYACSRPRT